ncbi:MAG TPA: alkaline phosphatase family protein [Mycobacteriales bacterium]|nr:alkaline phosphatase family protein [Mycobacteriales bacterium]
MIWIWFENRDYSQVVGAGSGAPHLASYVRRCGLATNYQAITHPSLPNYIAAVAGDTYGISSDCDPQQCSVRHPSLFAQVSASGRRWTSYAESMSRHCDTGSYGRYAARHNPAVYFPPIAGQCRRRDIPLGGLHGPLGSALDRNRLPAFAFVTPNLCNDGHDCSTSTADTWLGTWLDRITASRAYAAGRTVVFVTWDEGSSSNHVATVVIGPTVPRGIRSGAAFTHYSLLRTTEQLLGLPLLGRAASARSMRSAFHL